MGNALRSLEFRRSVETHDDELSGLPLSTFPIFNEALTERTDKELVGERQLR